MVFLTATNSTAVVQKQIQTACSQIWVAVSQDSFIDQN